MMPRIKSIYYHNVGVCDLVHVQFTHEIILYVLYVKALSTKNKPIHLWVKWLSQSNKAAIKNTKRNQIMSSTMKCSSVFYPPLFLCPQITWKANGVGAGGLGGCVCGKRPPFPSLILKIWCVWVASLTMNNKLGDIFACMPTFFSF
jgi:hypothetical protein